MCYILGKREVIEQNLQELSAPLESKLSLVVTNENGLFLENKEREY